MEYREITTTRMMVFGHLCPVFNVGSLDGPGCHWLLDNALESRECRRPQLDAGCIAGPGCLNLVPERVWTRKGGSDPAGGGVFVSRPNGELKRRPETDGRITIRIRSVLLGALLRLRCHLSAAMAKTSQRQGGYRGPCTPGRTGGR